MKNNDANLLVIDETEIHRNVLIGQLCELGYTNIYAAIDGCEGLKILDTVNIDGIVCDLNMPNMDGVQFLSELHKIAYSGYVIIFSAIEDGVTQLVSSMCKLLNFKYYEVIPKPITSSSLANIVKTIQLNKNTPLQFKKTPKITIDDVVYALKHNQIKNYYQPQYCFKTGKLIGLESLVRWSHPEYGLLTPIHFLPLIEEGNLYTMLFDVVFTHVLEDFSKYQFDGTISINATFDDVNQDNFSHLILSKCEKFNVSPKKLIIELTETQVFTESIIVLTNLARLKLKGVGLSIDDFGTGHSSLLKLYNFPFTEIKVDRSFIKDCIAKKPKQAIVQLSYDLASKMDMKIVAEGVEDEATWEYLKMVGYDTCQGFYSGKPMPIEALMITNESFLDA